MANLKKLYIITIKNLLVEGKEIDSHNGFIRTIQDDNGVKYNFPASMQVWDSYDERTVSIFAENAKKMDFDSVISKYHLSRDEAKIAFQKALDKFPEKFI